MIYHNVFTEKEINLLIKYFEKQPTVFTEYRKDQLRCNNKNLDYQIPGSLCNLIVRPKLEKILGPHDINMGSFKQTFMGYYLHFDDNQTHTEKPQQQLNKSIHHNCAVLIPLDAHESIKTVSFKIKRDPNLDLETTIKSGLVKEKNNLEVNDFKHFSEQHLEWLPYLPVDEIFSWEKGSIFVFSRDSLHCSNEFSKYLTERKFLILFIA